MCTASLCSNALRSLRLSSHLSNRRDAVFMTSEAAPLPARPFNHLSVLAYLAIGIVVLASSLVTGYLIHTCYRSATRKDANQGTIVDPESDPVAVYRQERSRRELELKPLVREFLHDEGSFFSDSRTVIGKRSFGEYAFVTPPPHLEYSSDCTVAVSPSFHIPSPSSPSPALEKRNRPYARHISHSPVSPSPSFFPYGSPPCNLSPYAERDRHAEHSINSNAKGIKRWAPGTQFDSNNIRYISPLEPCVADSTVKLYREPKLSPVHGSVISPSPGDGLLCPSHCTQPSFSQDIGVRHATNLTPAPMPPQRGRVISGQATVLPRLPEPRHKERINPISRQCVGQHSWELTLPIVHLKPGPGYF